MREHEAVAWPARGLWWAGTVMIHVDGIRAGPELGRVGVIDADVDAGTILRADDMIRDSLMPRRVNGNG